MELDENKCLKSRKHLFLHFYACENFGGSKSADNPDVFQSVLWFGKIDFGMPIMYCSTLSTAHMDGLSTFLACGKIKAYSCGRLVSPALLSPRVLYHGDLASSKHKLIWRLIFSNMKDIASKRKQIYFRRQCPIKKKKLNQQISNQWKPTDQWAWPDDITDLITSILRNRS